MQYDDRATCKFADWAFYKPTHVN